MAISDLCLVSPVIPKMTHENLDKLTEAILASRRDRRMTKTARLIRVGAGDRRLYQLDPPSHEFLPEGAGTRMVSHVVLDGASGAVALSESNADGDMPCAPVIVGAVSDTHCLPVGTRRVDGGLTKLERRVYAMEPSVDGVDHLALLSELDGVKAYHAGYSGALMNPANPINGPGEPDDETVLAAMGYQVVSGGTVAVSGGTDVYMHVTGRNGGAGVAVQTKPEVNNHVSRAHAAYQAAAADIFVLDAQVRDRADSLNRAVLAAREHHAKDSEALAAAHKRLKAAAKEMAEAAEATLASLEHLKGA